MLQLPPFYPHWDAPSRRIQYRTHQSHCRSKKHHHSNQYHIYRIAFRVSKWSPASLPIRGAARDAKPSRPRWHLKRSTENREAVAKAIESDLPIPPLPLPPPKKPRGRPPKETTEHKSPKPYKANSTKTFRTPSTRRAINPDPLFSTAQVHRLDKQYAPVSLAYFFASGQQNKTRQFTSSSQKDHHGYSNWTDR
jgi:hypothetical protein